MSAFERKNGKNCRPSEQVGMRILEDRSAPQGKIRKEYLNCRQLSLNEFRTGNYFLAFDIFKNFKKLAPLPQSDINSMANSGAFEIELRCR